jgi:hypothetical protein
VDIIVQSIGCYFSHSNTIFAAQTDHCSINSKLATDFPLFITPVEAIMHVSFLLGASRIYIYIQYIKGSTEVKVLKRSGVVLKNIHIFLIARIAQTV